MKSEKERKMFKSRLVLPILVLPFLTGIFWGLDGGQGPDSADKPAVTIGLKTDLPGASLKDDPVGKMSYYDRAKVDSAKQNELIRNDPYYRGDLSMGYHSDPLSPYSNVNTGHLNIGSSGNEHRNEALVMERLGQLNQTLNSPGSMEQEPYRSTANSPNSGMNKADLDRLEHMMQMMQSGEGNADPEMQQINGTLEKILDIQHPDRVTEKLRQRSALRKGEVFSVTGIPVSDPVSLLQSKYDSNRKQTNSFFSIDAPVTGSEQNSIAAVVHETQTLVEGAVVKMRLLNDIYINGSMIPKDNFIFGIASLSGERLNISIENIRYQYSLFPVRLMVYDLDGLEGIHIPGAITRDVAKQSGMSAFDGLSVAGLDPSLGAQAATAGIEITKNLIGRKVKLVKVTLKAGYRILLRDENIK